MRPIVQIATIACILFFAACAAPQKTIYFNDNTPLDQSVQVQKIERLKEAVVQPDDILAINVTTISSIADPKPVTIFNEGGTAFSITATIGGAGGGSSSSGHSNAYRVDEDGLIDFPAIGKIKVSGLTMRQVKDLLAQKLTAYIKDPVVEARIINYKVTVLGEVNHPGTIVAPNQKINILDAIAAAGDIPISGRKDNVLIIRETEGNREFARLDLNSRNVFNSPYYYLRQNDIVYVEPAKLRRQQNNEFLQFYLPTITALISTVLAVYGIVQITK
ncbi:MAG TPA: polysaccharide biosynthesis/export family protein [Flavipsychrobacter sp.]|nr:polysaccharide biosynthesis/export family protein [Flavipsychrobacter sp.]